jgi:hypothetical protein
VEHCNARHPLEGNENTAHFVNEKTNELGLFDYESNGVVHDTAGPGFPGIVQSIFWLLFRAGTAKLKLIPIQAKGRLGWGTPAALLSATLF